MDETTQTGSLLAIVASATKKLQSPLFGAVRELLDRSLGEVSTLSELLKLIVSRQFEIKRSPPVLLIVLATRLISARSLDFHQRMTRELIISCIEDLLLLADFLGEITIRKELAIELCSFLPKPDHHNDVYVPRELEMQRKRSAPTDLLTVSSLMSASTAEKYLMANAAHYSLDPQTSSQAVACATLLINHPRRPSPKFLADALLMRLTCSLHGGQEDIDTLQAMYPSIAPELSLQERDDLKRTIVEKKIQLLQREDKEDQLLLVVYHEGYKKFPKASSMYPTLVVSAEIFLSRFVAKNSVLFPSARLTKLRSQLSTPDFALMLKEIPSLLVWRGDEPGAPFILDHFLCSSQPNLSYELVKALKDDADFSDQERVSLRSLFGLLSALGHGHDRNEEAAKQFLPKDWPSLEAVLFIGSQLSDFEKARALSSQPVGLLSRLKRWKESLVGVERLCSVCNKRSTSNCPCGQVFYCSAVCQRQDWTRHKQVCPKRKK